MVPSAFMLVPAPRPNSDWRRTTRKKTPVLNKFKYKNVQRVVPKAGNGVLCDLKIVNLKSSPGKIRNHLLFAEIGGDHRRVLHPGPVSAVRPHIDRWTLVQHGSESHIPVNGYLFAMKLLFNNTKKTHSGVVVKATVEGEEEMEIYRLTGGQKSRGHFQISVLGAEWHEIYWNTYAP
jgi:hypothetical protein